jgi:hypothetical protein
VKRFPGNFGGEGALHGFQMENEGLSEGLMIASSSESAQNGPDMCIADRVNSQRFP